MKAKSPKLIVPSKAKFLISGKPGVGKTIFALGFPEVYYIDTEGGATREEYKEKLIASGAVYMGKDEGSQDFHTVIEEIRQLATTKHPYKTLVIDSFSKIYNIAAAVAEEEKGSEFGRDKKEANRPTRQLLRWLDNLDMNVLLVCHHREKWERKNGELVHAGTTFDGFDKLEYELDLWIEAIKEKSKRMFIVRKSRIKGFVEGAMHPLEFPVFAEIYGKDVIEKPSEPVAMASIEQVQEIKRLVEAVNLKPEVVNTWFTKAGVDKFEELKSEQIQKCIDHVRSLVIPMPVAEAVPAGKKAVKA